MPRAKMWVTVVQACVVALLANMFEFRVSCVSVVTKIIRKQCFVGHDLLITTWPHVSPRVSPPPTACRGTDSAGKRCAAPDATGRR